jgi:hypothetical protein
VMRMICDNGDMVISVMWCAIGPRIYFISSFWFVICISFILQSLENLFSSEKGLTAFIISLFSIQVSVLDFNIVCPQYFESTGTAADRPRRCMIPTKPSHICRYGAKIDAPQVPLASPKLRPPSTYRLPSRSRSPSLPPRGA